MISVEEKVANILKDFLTKNSIELYDLRFEKEGKDRYLRVFIDKETSISVDDCEMVSKFLSDKLDKNDPIEEQYYLEVSSPGAERELKKESDFIRFKGKKIKVKLINVVEGQKIITGKLIAKKGDVVIVEDECLKKEIEISLDDIRSIRNILEF